MVGVIKRLWQHGFGTIPKYELKRVFDRGKLALDVTKCTSCGDCIVQCPTEALSLHGDESGMWFSIAQGVCINCRVCREVCPTNALFIANEPLYSVRKRDQLDDHYRL